MMQATKQQQLARERNWSKFQIKGLHVPKSGLTENEIKIVQAIYNLQEMLIKDWDKNSCKLGLRPRKEALNKERVKKLLDEATS